jgi:hypothetical protein
VHIISSYIDFSNCSTAIAKTGDVCASAAAAHCNLNE